MIKMYFVEKAILFVVKTPESFFWLQWHLLVPREFSGHEEKNKNYTKYGWGPAAWHFTSKERQKKADVPEFKHVSSQGLQARLCLDVRIHGSNGGRANASVLKGDGTRSPDAGGGNQCSLSIPKWTKERKRLLQGKGFKNAEGSIEAVV